MKSLGAESGEHEECGMTTMLFSVLKKKWCHLQEGVSCHVVMLQQQRGVASPSQFCAFLSHTFTQVPKNITVKVRIHNTDRSNRFSMNDALDVKKKKKTNIIIILASNTFIILEHSPTHVTERAKNRLLWRSVTTNV